MADTSSILHSQHCGLRKTFDLVRMRSGPLCLLSVEDVLPLRVLCVSHVILASWLLDVIAEVSEGAPTRVGSEQDDQYKRRAPQNPEKPHGTNPLRARKSED